MAISQLTEFPIQTVLEFADQNEHGLCPQLCGSVSPSLSDCDLNKPVSERGIRIMLDGTDTTIGYVNLGSGYPIYSSSNGITALYNTLSADSDYITGFLSADTIFLSAFADSDTSTSGGSSGSEYGGSPKRIGGRRGSS